MAADVPATCPRCGSPITHARTKDGSTVPLERYTDSNGPRRYRIVRLGPPLLVEPVRAEAVIDAYPDHRLECPDFR